MVCRTYEQQLIKRAFHARFDNPNHWTHPILIATEIELLGADHDPEHSMVSTCVPEAGIKERDR